MTDDTRRSRTEPPLGSASGHCRRARDTQTSQRRSATSTSPGSVSGQSRTRGESPLRRSGAGGWREVPEDGAQNGRTAKRTSPILRPWEGRKPRKSEAFSYRGDRTRTCNPRFWRAGKAGHLGPTRASTRRSGRSGHVRPAEVGTGLGTDYGGGRLGTLALDLSAQPRSQLPHRHPRLVGQLLEPRRWQRLRRQRGATRK